MIINNISLTRLIDYFSLTKKEYNIFILFTLLNILDFITTKIILDQIGYMGELNPILYFLLVLTDTVYIILIIKLIIISIIFYCFINLTNNKYINRINVYNILYILCIVFSIVCVWNIYCVFTYNI